jgi:hypothetical protein
VFNEAHEAPSTGNPLLGNFRLAGKVTINHNDHLHNCLTMSDLSVLLTLTQITSVSIQIVHHHAFNPHEALDQR